MNRNIRPPVAAFPRTPFYGLYRPGGVELELWPITVFDVKGIPASSRERIDAAIVAAERKPSGPHEAWIAADPLRGGFKVLVTGPHGLERSVSFG